jgi:hypothetical protein
VATRADYRRKSRYRDLISSAGGRCMLLLPHYANVYDIGLEFAAKVQRLD